MAAHHEGHSLRQIAQTLGVGVATVDRMVRHPRNVDPVLLSRFLEHLRLQRLLSLAAALELLDRTGSRMVK
jgi:hypothetical protein